MSWLKKLQNELESCGIQKEDGRILLDPEVSSTLHPKSEKQKIEKSKS